MLVFSNVYELIRIQHRVMGQRLKIIHLRNGTETAIETEVFT